ncbi:RCC1 domain-containing protein [Paenibacillus sp. 2RAB27]|uniref:RCC1 domain-containing protein n=1 Tax=Paenibacillus sp. 2RAB27 TaxID=3232991 RepID=UPI003F9C9E97
MKTSFHTLHLKKLLLAFTAVGLLNTSPIIFSSAQAAADSSSASPQPVKVSAGLESYSLLDDEGHVWIIGKRVPTRVKGLENVSDFAFNGRGLAAREDGTVWEWSYQYNSPEDTTWYFPVTSPVQIPQLKNIVKVAENAQQLNAALDKEGTVWVWNSKHSLEKREEKAPVPIPALKKVKDITLFKDQVIALQEDGTVFSSTGFDDYTYNLSANWNLQINENTSYNIKTKQVPGLSDIVELGKGTNTRHLLALKKDGTVMAWGENHYGQLIGKLGDAEPIEAVQVPGLTDIISLTSGNTHSLALKKDATVWEWGYLTMNGSHDFEQITTPVQVKGLDHITAISSGFGFNTAIRQDGTLWAWGDNNFGQLSDDTNTPKFSPVHVSFPKPRWMLDLPKN